MRRIMLALCVLLVLAAAVACSGRKAAVPPQPRPDRATEIGVGVPIPDAKATDVDYVRQIMPPPGAPQAGWESTKLASFAEARRVFPQAMLPTETLGKRLVAIVYRSIADTSADPQQVLRLVYEDGLDIGVARYYSGPIGPAEIIPPSRELTAVAGVEANAEYGKSWASGPPETARVEWQVGKLHWTVWAQGRTKEEAVTVARSLAP